MVVSNADCGKSQQSSVEANNVVLCSVTSWRLARVDRTSSALLYIYILLTMCTWYIWAIRVVRVQLYLVHERSLLCLPTWWTIKTCILFSTRTLVFLGFAPLKSGNRNDYSIEGLPILHPNFVSNLHITLQKIVCSFLQCVLPTRLSVAYSESHPVFDFSNSCWGISISLLPKNLLHFHMLSCKVKHRIQHSIKYKWINTFIYY